MATLRYKYNPETCRYEPFYIKGKVLRNRITLFMSLALVIASVGFYLTIERFQSFDELMLGNRNSKLKVEWSILHQRILTSQKQLNEFISKDDNNYRVILDSSPLPATIREAGTGGSENLYIQSAKGFPYIVADHLALQKLQHRADIELQSFDELGKILNGKLISWAMRPAIQPISNDDLIFLHLTFGTRLHPIFKVWKEHKGLDFAANKGTDVYATGDGVIAVAHFSESFGNVIYVDHGSEFQTRYAHLSGFAVAPGETVKRGQLIGYVGSTGHSKAPHLHYEVLIHGDQVNPINFFQRDLSNVEYEKLIELGSKNTTPLD
jgi:murein DD-endopeptidase MepM/ murein hydrolase activator NlpD